MSRCAVSCEHSASFAHFDEVILPSYPFNNRLTMFRCRSLSDQSVNLSRQAFGNSEPFDDGKTEFRGGSGRRFRLSLTQPRDRLPGMNAANVDGQVQCAAGVCTDWLLSIQVLTIQITKRLRVGPLPIEFTEIRYKTCIRLRVRRPIRCCSDQAGRPPIDGHAG